jgi:uncharacterized membrane protein
MNDPLLFGLSLAFLLGVVLTAASVVPTLRERYPRLMLQGFLLAVGAVLGAFVVALLRG